jgi:hypothetical protein
MELRRVIVFAVVIAGGALAVLAGCSPGDSNQGQTCDAVDSGCPSQPPSFSHDVDPIVVTYCNGCHGAGGVAQALYDYTSYQGIARSRSSIATFVGHCLMPPADAAVFPSDEQRQVILQWIACGAPNN